MRTLQLVGICFLILSAGTLAAPQSVQVKAEDKARPLSPEFFGFNVNATRGPALSDPRLLAVLKDLRPSLLRYPGGQVSNYWEWRRGWFVDDREALLDARQGYRIIPVLPAKLENLKQATEVAGARPVWSLNMLTSGLEEQLEMLRSARVLGLDVKYVELGNEFYLASPSLYVKKFPTAKDYALESSRWIAALKKEFPGVRVAVVGGSYRPPGRRSEDETRRRNSWSSEVIRNVQGADALTIHIYVGSALAVQEDAGAGADPEAGGRGMTGSDAQRRAQAAALQAPGGVSRFLSGPFRIMRTEREHNLKQLPAEMKCWVTEYNLFDRVGAVHTTWAHGLHSALMTCLLLDEPQVELACFHQLVGSVAFCAMFAGREVEEGKQPATGTLAASGAALRFISNALRGMNSARRLVFEPCPQVSAPNRETYPALLGWLVTDGRASQAVILNLSEREFTINPRRILPGGVFQQLHAAPTQKVFSPQDVSQQEGALADTLTLPPYSLTRLLTQGNGG